MATKFSTSTWGIRITPIEIEKEDEHYIYSNGVRLLKKDFNFIHHDTHEQAKQHLIERTEKHIKHLSEQLAAEKANLAKLQELKK